jgi:polyisoprenoid-binding protein YceI
MDRSKRRLAAVGGLVVVVAVAAVAGWWFLIRDDAPAPADIDTAAQTLGQDGDEAVDAADLAGTWTVDGSIGSFDDFSGTWAGYRFDEELGTIGANTAVGRTPDVTGTMTVTEDEVSAVDVEVDMTTLQSDESRRDDALKRRGLETDAFPTATISLTEPLALPEGVGSGEEVSTTATGELTVHGTTSEVTVEVDAKLTGDGAVVVGRAPVVLDDFDIEPPTNAVVLSVDDEGMFEFQIFLTRT